MRSLELSPEQKRFKATLEALSRRAKTLGVNIHGIVRHNGWEHSMFADEPIYGASLAKLPLAHMVIDELYADDVLEVEKRHVVPSGGGEFDTFRKSPTASVGELLDDMLRRSGNTPFRLFTEILGGAEKINDYYKEKGWEMTSVNERDGKCYMGMTTPHEVFLQFQTLLDREDDNPLLDTAQDALKNSKVVKTGIRQRVAPSLRLTLSNKTGEYNGDTDEFDPVPYAVRHDAGRVIGSTGQVDYVVMTTSNMKTRGMVANMFVGQFGAEFARAVGGPATTLLGSLALRA